MQYSYFSFQLIDHVSFPQFGRALPLLKSKHRASVIMKGISIRYFFWIKDLQLILFGFFIDEIFSVFWLVSSTDLSLGSYEEPLWFPQVSNQLWGTLNLDSLLCSQSWAISCSLKFSSDYENIKRKATLKNLVILI